MTPTCPLCDRPVSDASFCSTCADGMRADLVTADWLSRPQVPRGGLFVTLSEIDVTVVRQAKTSQSVGGRSTETPMVWHDKASEAGRHLHAVLVSWARLVVEERPAGSPDDVGLPLWLVGQVEWLRHHPAGVEAVTEVSGAVTAVLRIIDRPPERRWLGLCEAPTELGLCEAVIEALPEDHAVTCRGCGHVHDVDERVSRMLAAVDDQLWHASMMARQLSWMLGEAVKPELLRKWAERKRLLPHGLDGSGRPLYRVGDVRDLLRRRSA